jgi:hypothetical protein
MSNKHAHSPKELSSNKTQANEGSKVDLGKHARDLLAINAPRKAMPADELW